MADRMTIAGAVTYLAARGVRRQPDTIRWWIRRGYLPALRVDGRLHILERDLLLAERDTRQRTRQQRTTE